MKRYYEQLKRYERSFKWAMEGKSVESGVGFHQLNQLAKVLEAVTGEKVKVNSCRQCKIDMCAKVGKLYFAYADELENPSGSKENVKTPSDDGQGKEKAAAKRIRKPKAAEESAGKAKEDGAES